MSKIEITEGVDICWLPPADDYRTAIFGKIVDSTCGNIGVYTEWYGANGRTFTLEYPISALHYYSDGIKEDAIYILTEKEKLALQLKYSGRITY